jgi:hypothetical protein
MSLNTFNTFDVSDVPPAPPAADGMMQPPSSNVAPSSDLEAQCREQIKELKRRMEALERLLPQRPGSAAAAVTPTPPQPPKRVTFGQTQIGKYTPLRSLNRPMPFGAAPPPEPASPAATAAAPPLPAMAPQAAPSAPIAVPEPSFITINDVSIGARATPVIDTTRLDPAAQGLFLPSAIPARGEPNFGLGERATIQGQGSSAGLNWIANLPAVGTVTGAAKIEILDTNPSTFSTAVTQAWLNWQNLIFGQTETLFSDVMAIPETIDLGGPSSRVSVRSGTPEIRYLLYQPGNAKDDPTGFYAGVSAELPTVGVFVPAGFQTFSRYPDFIATIKYEQGTWGHNPCDDSQYFQGWHVQLGAVVRDIGVEDSNKQKSVLREETTGWGLQLSGRYTILRECPQLVDFFIFNVAGGEGIARYFETLFLVNPVNDASFNPANNELTALPVLGYFAAYQHDWSTSFRSTVCYSHLELEGDDHVVAAGTSPYRRGDYVAANLIWHYDVCETGKDNVIPSSSNTSHSLYAGIEYLFGHKEDLNGNTGQDHRIMLMVAATK